MSFRSRLGRQAHGKSCTYCDRAMSQPRPDARKTSATRDHVDPVSLGGKVWVLACRQCNDLKGDMTSAQWRTFMVMFPRWWTRFATNKEARIALASLSTPAFIDRIEA